MKFWLLLSVLPVFAGQPRPASPVVLYTDFEQAPPAGVLNGLQEELTNLMRPLGYEFSWRALADVHGTEPVPELAVVHFKGRCNLDSPSGHGRTAGPLGWTHISDGAILPFSDVDCNGIREFLSDGLTGLRADERESAFGRALGRVLAHELYHVFMKTSHHAARGVAKPAYSIADLLGAEFKFE